MGLMFSAASWAGGRPEPVEFRNDASKDITFREANETYAKEIEELKILEIIKDDSFELRRYPRYSGKNTYFNTLINQYIGCYPHKSYYDWHHNRAGDFHISATAGILVDKVIEDRFLVAEGFRAHSAMEKSFFAFDLQEKEAIIALLNYAKDDNRPMIDIYVSSTAPANTVGKGVELVRTWMQGYVDFIRSDDELLSTPYTLHTSTCSE